MIFRFEPDCDDEGGGSTQIAARIEDYLESRCVPGAALAQLMIAFDEVISNVLNHGRPGALEVSVSVEGDRVLAEVADDGAAFDPLALPEPDTTAGIEEREAGGLGVHIVRRLMDDVVYSRDGGWNRLRFSKTFDVG